MGASASASGPWRAHVASRWSNKASVGPWGHCSSCARCESAGRPPADRARSAGLVTLLHVCPGLVPSSTRRVQTLRMVASESWVLRGQSARTGGGGTQG
eukprot:9904554-Alexandrium_andersonii.AAC.1